MSDCRVCGAKCPGWFMCAPCGHELERAIAEMPSLMAELSNVATGQTRVYRASAGAQPDAELHYDPEAHIPAYLRSRDGRTALRPTRLMVRLDIRELMWICGNTLSSWARHLSETRGIDLPVLYQPPQFRRVSRLVIHRNRAVRVDDWAWSELERPAIHGTADALAVWLVANVNSIRLDEAAAECHDEITTIHRQAERAVDRSPSRLFAGPCHADVAEPDVTMRDGTVYVTVLHGKCQRDLYAWPGAEKVVCDGFRGDELGCGTTHTAVTRRDWLLAAVEDALLPLEVLKRALPVMVPDAPVVAESTWRSWVLRGRLEPRSADRQAVELFRGGDVIRLVEDQQIRSGPRRRRAG